MMKKMLCFALLGILLLSLGGCEFTQLRSTQPVEETTLSPATENTVFSEPEITEPVTEITEPEVTKPEHSSLYLPGVAAQDVVLYFNEVCLDAEFSTEGEPSLLQKWELPIYYRVNGAPTEEDLAVLEGFAAWLNTLEGFPGMYECPEEQLSSLNIYFCSREELVERMGPDFQGVDGGVTFWYQDHKIHDGIICIATELDQELRNSVILEEVYNGLGPVQDTALRPDSIIYAEFSQPQALTEMDELILKLLYHPDMLWGMDASQCQAVIGKLYY